MFNTLKEMQESLSYDDLCKYANESLGKSSTEIKEILKSHDVEISDNTANECYEFLKGINIMSDDELDNVAGGTCYSSETYDSLGMRYNFLKQLGKYHPIITTVGNHCSFAGKTECPSCTFFSKFNEISGYCGTRSKEYDPYSN